MIRSVARTVLVGSVMIMLGACTTVRPPVDEPSPAAPSSTDLPVYAGPELPDLKADRVWSAVMKSSDARVIALTDDAVVLSDGDYGTFAVGADGKKRWTLPKKLKLSKDVTEAIVISDFGRTFGAGSGQAVVAAYQSHGDRACWGRWKDCGYDEQPHLGVMALSADSGKPVWSTRLEPTLPIGADPEFVHFRVKAVTGTVALVEVVPELEDRTPLLVALDAKTGDQLWSQRGLEVEWADGNRVLARRPGSAGDGDNKRYPELLDARTGQRLWRGSMPGHWTGTMTNGYAIAVLSSSSGQEVLAVDLASGESQADPTKGGTVGRDESGVFLANARPGTFERYTLVSANHPGGPLERGQHEFDRPQVLTAVGPYLWISTTRGGSPDRATTALDRTGAQRLKPLPGMLLAVDKTWLVTGNWLEFSIYRLS